MRSLRLIGLSILSFLFLSLPALAGPSPGDKITDFAINRLNGLFDAVKTALPTVTKYTLQVTQLGCEADLLYGGALAVLDLVSIFVCYKLIMFLSTKFNSCDDKDAPKVMIGVILAIVSGAAGLILIVGALSYLLDFWSWICVAHPDAYLIHLAVQKVVH